MNPLPILIRIWCSTDQILRSHCSNTKDVGDVSYSKLGDLKVGHMLDLQVGQI